MFNSAPYHLFLLTFSYVIGELSHFLLGVTSRDIARDLHYGDKACFPESNELDSNQSDICSAFGDLER